MASKPFTEAIFELVGELSSSVGEVSHPLLVANKTGKELTLIITSDRGLCGPYNGSVLRAGMAHLRTNPAAKAGAIELVGKKGVSFLKYAGVPVAQQHTQFGDKPKYELVRDLAESYIQRYIAGELSSVKIVAMKYISAGVQKPEVTQLLPFRPSKQAQKAKKESAYADIYEFSPSATELLGDLLPAAVKAVLFQIFNDAVVSEHIARMVAMKAATDAAGKMGKLYTRKFNRARQAQITTELTEIIGGAAALA